MKYKVKDVSDTRKEVSVSATADETKAQAADVLKAFAAQAALPGFRAGKAPAHMVAQRYRKEIAEELKSKLAAKAYEVMTKEAKLPIYALVKVDGADFKEGEAGNVVFTVDVKPDFKLPEYKGIEVKGEPVAVSDKEVDDALATVRNQRAEYKPVERAVAAGDYVRVGYTGTLDGKPVAEIAPERPILGTQASTWEEAAAPEGTPCVRAIVDGIVGMKVGDKKTVSETFPKDFGVAALAGKTAQYDVEVKEVREKSLPELDEAFFKSVGADSLEKFREILKKDIERGKQQKNRDAKRAQVMELLAASPDFPLPESAVDDETQDILRQYMQDQLRHGAKEEDFEKNKEALFRQATQAAQKRVKLNLILEKIADAEKIKVENADLQNRIIQEAIMTRQKPEAIVKMLQKDRALLANLQKSLRLAKTLEFVLDQTKEKAA